MNIFTVKKPAPHPGDIWIVSSTGEKIEIISFNPIVDLSDNTTTFGIVFKSYPKGSHIMSIVSLDNFLSNCVLLKGKYRKTMINKIIARTYKIFT